MKSSHVLGLLALCCLQATWGVAQDSKNHPAAKHAKAGLICFDCHQEENPKKGPASDDSCMACHGDFPAMAAVTKKLAVNPHDAPPAKHPKQNQCFDCHRQHQAPVVKCLECHATFKLTAK